MCGHGCANKPGPGTQGPIWASGAEQTSPRHVYHLSAVQLCEMSKPWANTLLCILHETACLNQQKLTV